MQQSSEYQVSVLHNEEDEDEGEDINNVDYIADYKMFKEVLRNTREICTLNVSIFIKLFKLSYFQSPALGLSPAEYVCADADVQLLSHILLQLCSA